MNLKVRISVVMSISAILLFACRSSSGTDQGTFSNRKDRSLQGTTHGEKFALLIGIDDYVPKKTSKNDSNGADLNGCVKDVKDVRHLLETKFGFKKECIREVLDTDATRDNIDQAFHQHLVENAKKHPDGTFVFHFSGHGATDVPDYSGDEIDDKDECIVPSDLDPIVDDEIADWSKELANVTKGKGNITFIFDCCHSGSITRDTGLTYRRLSVKELALDKLKKRTESRSGNQKKSSGNRLLPPSDDYVAISACTSKEQEPETTESDRSKRNGVLTRTLTELLEKADTNLSYRDLRDRLASRITRQYNITPQVYGNLERLIFSGSLAKFDSSIPVTELKGRRVRINAGRAMGIRTGAVVAFYRSADVTTRRNAVAQGTVVESSGTTSVVELKGTFKPDELTDARAVLVTPFVGSDPLVVGFVKGNKSTRDGAKLEGFRESIMSQLAKSEKKIEVDTVEANSESELNAIQGWDTKLVSDTFANFAKAAKFKETNTQNSNVPKPDDIVYFLASRNSQPLYQFFVLPDDESAVDKVVDALEKRAGQQTLLSLTNEAGSPLNKALCITGYRITKWKPDPDDERQIIVEEREPLDAGEGETAKLKAGDRYELEVKNISGKPLYLNVLVVTNGGRVVPAYYDSDPMAKDKVVKIGPTTARLPEGIDAFKFIVTEQEADFRFVRQGAITRGGSTTRGDTIKEMKSGLEGLIFAGINRTREVDELPAPPPPDRWGVDRFEIEVSEAG